MATGPGVNQGKTAFLEAFLPGHRDAALEAVNEAWTAAGHDDTISGSLMSKIRTKLGLTSKRGANGGAAKKTSGPSSKGKAGSSPKGAKPKLASEAVEAPTPPNGREGDTGPSKSAFVEELLRREPQANVKAVNEAWNAAGHEGTISPSVFFKVKRERVVVAGASPGESQPGASGAGPDPSGREAAQQYSNGRESATTTTAAAGSGASGDLGRVVDKVEAGIDDLMFTLKANGGMPEVEVALRAARRLLVRSQE